jgi:hypothetical protein
MTEVTEVTMHQTSDGELFHDKDLADGHAAMLRGESEADRYLAGKEEMKPSAKTRARNSILDFLAWQKNQA